MKLTLNNCSDPALRRVLEKTFKAATEFLGVNNHAVEVQVDLELKTGKAISVYNGQYLSATLGETDSHIRGNTAKVRLYAFNTPQLVDTLAHELTHVAQNLRGDLKCACGAGTIWKGRLYSHYQVVVDYENLPWEIEARAVGAQIARRVLQ